MYKSNWTETKDKFRRWWMREDGLKLVVADTAVKSPQYTNITDFADYSQNLKKHKEFFGAKSYHGECFPDLGPYLGPGSLATFIGSEPIYDKNTIWFSETDKSLIQIRETADRFLKSSHDPENPEFKWYKWTINSAKYYKENSNGNFIPSMPDIEQNLDILSAVMSPERLLYCLIDEPIEVRKTLDKLYLVWEKVFDEITDIIRTEDGHTAFTHYNILGKGTTSILQSDISCMLSEEMFNEFELPYLKMQAEKIDNIIYHLDGPGAVRHLDSLLKIDNINAVQWVPGAGQPGNSDELYYDMYDKITESGKGLYVYISPEEISEFSERYHNSRILIRTKAQNEQEQLRLVKDFL